jgi:hypothetical protein
MRPSRPHRTYRDHMRSVLVDHDAVDEELLRPPMDVEIADISRSVASAIITLDIVHPPPPLAYIVPQPSDDAGVYVGQSRVAAPNNGIGGGGALLPTNEVGCQASEATTDEAHNDAMSFRSDAKSNGINIEYRIASADAAVNTSAQDRRCNLNEGAGNSMASVVDAAVNTDGTSQHQQAPLSLPESSSTDQNNFIIAAGILAFNQQPQQITLLTPNATQPTQVDAVTYDSVVASTWVALESAESVRRDVIADMEYEVAISIFNAFYTFLATENHFVQEAVSAAQRQADEAVQQMRMQSECWASSLKQVCNLVCDESGLRSEGERNALESLALIGLSWQRDRVNAEILAAQRTAASVDAELLKMRNDGLRLENTTLMLRRQLHLMRTAKMGMIAEQQDCNPLLPTVAAGLVDGRLHVDQEQQVSATAPSKAAQNAGHEGPVHVTLVTTAAALREQFHRPPSLLDEVDINLPIHERFARAQRVAANICHEQKV